VTPGEAPQPETVGSAPMERVMLIRLLEAYRGGEDDPVLDAYLRDNVLPGLRTLRVPTEIDKVRAQLENARRMNAPGLVALRAERLARLEAQQ
jgi:hypothetical protein